MRKTTKVYKGGSRIRIVKGNITKITGGKYVMWGKGITFSGKKVITKAKEGIVYGKYIPPEEVYTTHPKVDKVEFIDEQGNILNENVYNSSFFYGQKVKIKVTTKNTKDKELIHFELKGKTQSNNQPFDIMNGSKYRWRMLEIINNQVETDYFTLNPNWYSDDFEEYDDNNFNTKIEKTKLNEFFVKILFNAKDVYLPLQGERLKPISYKRNYEELLGLSKTTKSTSPIDKDLIDNYENEFIDKYQSQGYPEIKIIVDDFSEYLCEDLNCTTDKQTIDEIKKKVIESGKNLWDEAVNQNKENKYYEDAIDSLGNPIKKLKVNPPILDDRPLYWARIAMQVILKRQYVFIKEILTLPQSEQDKFFKESIIPKGSELEKVIQQFEIHSRNYENIVFSKAVGNKKLLMLGFDTFYLDENILQSNPSGVSILNLHNQNIGGYHIQCFMMPVRYKDFDEFENGVGIIEKFVKPFITKADMIITISQNSSPLRFNIERFASKRREGLLDNMMWGDDNVYYAKGNYFKKIKPLKPIPNKNLTNEEFYETTLPVTNIVPKSAKTTLYKFPVFFNQTFHAKENGTDIKFSDKYIEGYLEIEKLKKINQPKIIGFNKSIDQFNLDYLQNSTKSYEGSGGFYLSNESFYRVARLRDNFNENLKTGHYHIPIIQNETLENYSSEAHKMRLSVGFDKLQIDLDPKYIAEIVRIVKELIEKSN